MDNEKFRSRVEIASQIKLREVVLQPDGNLVDISNLDASGRQEIVERCGLIVKKPESELRLSTELARKMVEMDWFDFEASSGKGHVRFYPKGAVVYSLLENMLGTFAQDRLGAMPVVTPMVFNWQDEQILSEAGTFNENLYHVRAGTNPEEGGQVIRFGGDFGVFKLIREARLKEDQLPLRLYEGGVMFRSNKPGERLNIQRLDSFYLPCCYSFCRNNISAGIEEFTFLHNQYSDFLKQMGLDYGLHFEINEDFFEAHRGEIVSLLQHDNNPAVIRLASGKRHYYEMKSDHVVANSFKSFNLQLDNQNGENYGINYEDGQSREPCVIVHSSFASIERWMLIFLNDALNKSPQELPLWMAPVQLRVIPVDDRFLETATEIAKSLRSFGVRVDVDDRKGKINSKIKKASTELVPYTLIWGNKEDETLEVNLRSRNGRLTPFSLEDLVAYMCLSIKESDPGIRHNPQLPLWVSKTPTFSQ